MSLSKQCTNWILSLKYRSRSLMELSVSDPGNPQLSGLMRVISPSPTVDVSARRPEWMYKTIPDAVIALSDDLDEIFRVIQAPEIGRCLPRSLPYLSIWTGYLSCRAEGKILCSKTADYSSGPAEAMQDPDDIYPKTEYCIFLCSRKGILHGFNWQVRSPSMPGNRIRCRFLQ